MRLPAALAALAALAVLGYLRVARDDRASYADYQRTYQAGPAPVDTATEAALAEAAGDPAAAGHVGISDEQDFSAVSSREAIESDKERIAQNRAQYRDRADGAT